MKHQFALVQKSYPVKKPDTTIAICIKHCASGADALMALAVARIAYRRAGGYKETLTSAANPLRNRAKYEKDGVCYRLFVVAPDGAHVEWKRIPERDESVTLAQIARRKARFEKLAKSKIGLLA